MNHLDKKEISRKKNQIKYCSLVAFGNNVGQILDDCHYIVSEHNSILNVFTIVIP